MIGPSPMDDRGGHAGTYKQWRGDRFADRPRVLLIFIIQNTDRVRFQFLFWSPTGRFGSS
jgi:hypothetical protein